METNENVPSLARLRNRQTELVAALAVETSTSRLAALSAELESVLERIQELDRQAPASPGSGQP